MAVSKRPASRHPLVYLKTRVVGVDAKGWRWVATWKTSGSPTKIQRCVTDVCLTKHKDGAVVPKRPYQTIGKSGNGRCQLRAPAGISGPAGAPNGGWTGLAGTGRPYWSRFAAWYFCRRPPGCTLQEYFTRDGQSWKWAGALCAFKASARVITIFGLNAKNPPLDSCRGRNSALASVSTMITLRKWTIRGAALTTTR